MPDSIVIGRTPFFIQLNREVGDLELGVQGFMSYVDDSMAEYYIEINSTP
ncbi:MAG: hypothetical protein QG635_1816 [Bacteroidota bacterium]|nr:hypothetical protein [Bacteroidota bacterium]